MARLRYSRQTMTASTVQPAASLRATGEKAAVYVVGGGVWWPNPPAQEAQVHFVVGAGFHPDCISESAENGDMGQFISSPSSEKGALIALLIAS